MTERNSRRALLKSLAAAPVLPAALAAQEPASPMAAEAEALTQFVRARFGEYLSPAEMAEVRTGVERMLRNGEALARVKIGNADGPDYLFHPHDSR